MKEMDEIEKDKTRQTGPMDAAELQELDEGWMRQDEIDRAMKVGIWSDDFDKQKRKYIEEALDKIKEGLRRKYGIRTILHSFL